MLQRAKALQLTYDHIKGSEESYVFDKSMDGANERFDHIGVYLEKGHVQGMQISFADTTEGKLQDIIGNLSKTWGSELLKYKFDSDHYMFLLQHPSLDIELYRRLEIYPRIMTLQLMYTYWPYDSTMIPYIQGILESEPPPKPEKL